MTEKLSYEVVVKDGIIEIPEEYVDLCGTEKGYSFAIKIGKKQIRLETSNEDGVELDEDQYEIGEDGKNYLRYLTETNKWDRKHIIPKVYIGELGKFEENQKFYIRVGRKKMRLLSANYYNKDGEPLETED
jgi:hypothetical protein|tara:strand:- start:3228 stop:3620 length:393 start_codon:yes stop_codon:yes gene_type:complete